MKKNNQSLFIYLFYYFVPYYDNTPMFNFGLFSTHLPYIVIAAMYVLYLGSIALNKLGSKEIEQAATALVIKPTDQASNPDLKIIHYQEIQDKDFHAEVIIAKRDFTPRDLPPILLYIPDFKITDQYSFSSFFSRPPPCFC
ncbi:MAG: hypothetical protein JW830_01335 [Bacteroidales bacterium]|nr:hypothetical protein [Bacteroidales bacterium]